MASVATKNTMTVSVWVNADIAVRPYFCNTIDSTTAITMFTLLAYATFTKSMNEESRTTPE